METRVIVGSSHLALVTTCGYLKFGQDVLLLVETDQMLEDLRKLIFPIFEPGLETIFFEGFKSNRLTVELISSSFLDKSNFIFLAEDVVKTSGGVNLSKFKSLVSKITDCKKESFYLAICTQIPVGTCNILSNSINADRGPDAVVTFLCVPEFLRLGTAIDNFISEDYIHIVGSDDDDACKEAHRILSCFPGPKETLKLAEAEFSKHFANIAAAVDVSLTSELTKLANGLGINLLPVSKVMRKDPRIGTKAYILPGLGFTGGNLERDIQIVKQKINELGKPSTFLDAVVAVNEEHNKNILENILDFLGACENPKICFFGATYKPFSDSLSGSLTISFGKELIKKGVSVSIYDPVFKIRNPAISEGLGFFDSIYNAAKDADCLVYMVQKTEFSELDFRKLGRIMKQTKLFDATNSSDIQKLISIGFNVRGIGIGI